MRPNQLLAQLAYDGRRAEEKMAQTVDKFVKGADTIDRRFANTNKRIVDRTKSAAASAKVFERELAKQTKQLDALRGSLDPAFAATQRFQQQQELLNQAFKRGDLAGEEYKRLLSLLQAEFDLTSSAAVRAGNGIEQVARSSRRGTAQLQNVAFQVGDFATQVGAGTSASIALGQQLPQLLGGFGALGAVLGAVVAVGVPLSRTLISAGEEAKTLDERIEILSAAVTDYSNAVSNANISTDELAERYGRASEAARQFFVELRNIAEVEVVGALGDVVSSILGEIDLTTSQLLSRFTTLEEVVRTVEGLREEAADTGNAGLAILLEEQAATLADAVVKAEEFASAMQITGDEALRLANAVGAFEAAQGIDAQIEAASILQSLLTETFGTYEEMPAAIQDIFREIATTSQEMLKFKEATGESLSILDSVVISVRTVADTIGIAVGQTDNLVAGLAKAVVEAYRVAEGVAVAFNARVAAGPDGAVNDVRERLTPRGTSRDDVVSTLTSPGRSRSSSSGRRSGGGGRASERQAENQSIEATAEREIRSLQSRIRELGKTRAEVAALRVEHRLLEEARRKNIDLDAVAADSGKTAREVIADTAAEVGRLEEQYRRASVTQDQFTSAVASIGDAFADAIVEGKNFRESLRDIFNQIASDLISSGVQQLISGVFSGVGGAGGQRSGLGGFLGGLLSFDGGGYTGAGARTGGVDGRGGFPAILHPDETVIDHSRSGSGGSMSVSVVHQWNISANGDESVRRIIQREMPAIEQRTTGAVQEAMRRGQIKR